MKLLIDGYEIIPKPEQSLFDMLGELGLIHGKLSTDPIAARIAGRIFTLNYIPLRQKDLTPDRSSVRKAMAASGGVVKLLYYTDHDGMDAYTRTAQFVLFLAIRRLWPAATAKMTCTLGTGMYVRVTGVERFDTADLRGEVDRIVGENFLLRRRRIAGAKARASVSVRLGLGPGLKLGLGLGLCLMLGLGLGLGLVLGLRRGLVLLLGLG